MKLKYKVIISKLKHSVNKQDFEDYKYGEGYLVLHWRIDPKDLWNFYGFITPCNLKFRLGEKKYNKFLKGQKMFTM